MAREAKIEVQISLDDKNVPEAISWKASDGPQDGRQADAMLLSFWDPDSRNTLSIDLWTPRLTIDEMNFFVLESLLKMAATYRKATKNQEVADLLDGFGKTLTARLEELAKTKSEPRP